MSEILIKGMEMPKSCLETIGDNYKVVKICPFRELCIRKWGGYIGALNVHSDACPLVEVLPHGRLIDADFFKEYAIRVSTEDGKEYIPSNYVDIVPTIIEASK